MKTKLFSNEQGRIFCVTRWNCILAHAIVDEELHEYKQVVGTNDKVVYTKKLESIDTRTLADLIYEYKILDKILDFNVHRISLEVV